MNISFFIARRYIRSKKRSGFISISTWISVIGTFIGAAALIISLSVLGGFESIVIDRFISVDSHVRVYPSGEKGYRNFRQIMINLAGLPEVTGLSPYIMGKAMISSEFYNTPILLKGIDPETIDSVTDLRKRVELGSLDLDDSKGGIPKILIAGGVSNATGIMRGDTVTVLCPHGMRGVDITTVPLQQFVVSGYFNIGITEYDQSLCLISLTDAQRLFRMPGIVTGIEILTKDRDRADAAGKKAAEIAGSSSVYKTWYDLHKSLYISMRLERIGTILALNLIILVAVFNISSSLIMMVMEKKREVGILLSIGATRRMIRKIFLLQGFINGGMGIVLGLLTGFLVTWSMKTFKLLKLPQDVYIIETLPININGTDFVIVGMVSLVLIVFAAVYPARKAAGLDPVEALRYE